ncbi:CBO0543 family protein [Neobacillus sp. NPDC093182]|uniref:CBO0543 family protein n=1 Tax=Neobacillus sp. NPDC093182 TaxID=3364297 RepID=UPI0037FAE65C
MLIPWIIWAKLVNRRRLLEIILVGTLAIIPTIFLNDIGSELKFWTYPFKFFPVAPSALPFDMSIVAVAFMLLYQTFEQWKNYMVALLIMPVLIAFIGEPISKALNLVYYIRWKYYYSFFYYIILGITIKFIVNKCRDIYLKE